MADLPSETWIYTILVLAILVGAHWLPPWVKSKIPARGWSPRTPYWLAVGPFFVLAWIFQTIGLFFVVYDQASRWFGMALWVPAFWALGRTKIVGLKDGPPEGLLSLSLASRSGSRELPLAGAKPDEVSSATSVPPDP